MSEGPDWGQKADVCSGAGGHRGARLGQPGVVRAARPLQERSSPKPGTRAPATRLLTHEAPRQQPRAG